jgi:hypothetical protein
VPDTAKNVRNSGDSSTDKNKKKEKDATETFGD